MPIGEVSIDYRQLHCVLGTFFYFGQDRLVLSRPVTDSVRNKALLMLIGDIFSLFHFFPFSSTPYLPTCPVPCSFVHDPTVQNSNC